MRIMLNQEMWLSIRDIAGRLGITRATVACMVESKFLPKPTYFPIHNRVFHWNMDDLEMFLFKNAKRAVNAKG